MVAVAYLTGRKRIIEKLLSERIETTNTLSYDERVIQALKTHCEQIGPTSMKLSMLLPSSQVIFKELSLPFTGTKKIKMVVPFEVEAMLPFALDAAVIDSIVTKEDLAAQHTDVLVAAVKKEHIEHASVFSNRPASPAENLGRYV